MKKPVCLRERKYKTEQSDQKQNHSKLIKKLLDSWSPDHPGIQVLYKLSPGPQKNVKRHN